LSAIRVLVVEDFAPFRRYISSTLEQRPSLQVVGEASDGLEAVQKADELQPDLILLDIGLPSLNGIESARQIRKHSPNSKILFVSENRSPGIAQGAFDAGASGYVVKSDAARDLWPAVEAVLQGKRFVSASLGLTNPTEDGTDNHPYRKRFGAPIPPQNAEIVRHHVAGFYSDDRGLLEDLTQFIGAALRAGSGAIVVATESHRDSLLPRLQALGLDIVAAIEQGRYIALDAADTLSIFMRNGMPDAVRFMKAFGDLILTAAKAAKGEYPRVAVFGECVHLLWAQGNAEAAVQMEKLGNQLTNSYEVDILCGYSLDSVQGGMDYHIFQRICAEHSAVHHH
jgi:DNA-binding NarL/FixJ family response regulator